MLYWSSFLLFLFRLRFRLSISVFFLSFLSVDYLFGCFICWYWCNRSSFFFFILTFFFFLLLLEIFWADIAVRVFSLFTGLTYGSSAASSTKVTRLFPQVKGVVCLYVHVHHARVFGSFSHDYSYQRRCKVDSQNAGLNTWGRGPQLLSFFYFFSWAFSLCTTPFPSVMLAITVLCFHRLYRQRWCDAHRFTACFLKKGNSAVSGSFSFSRKSRE